jgi:hypothetical protein
MWIVRLALRRPYTFVVVAMLTAVLGAVRSVRVFGSRASAVRVTVPGNCRAGSSRGDSRPHVGRP